MGQFNNYVTLKLPFYDPPTTPPTISLLRYVTPVEDPTTLYHLFFFFEVEKKKKKQTNKDTHSPMIHPHMFLSN